MIRLHLYIALIILVAVIVSVAYYGIVYRLSLSPEETKKTETPSETTPTTSPTTTPSSVVEEKVVIYTYDSLLAWGEDPEMVYDKVFNEFERRTGIEVEVVKFGSAGEAVAKVIEEYESGNVRADVIIGIDAINLIKAKERGVLEPYTPSNIDEIPSWLIESFDPQHYAIPFDYGLIAFVYDRDYISDDVMENITFESFYNPDLASTLIVEDPRTSSTGLNFLLYEITVYSKILGKDWKEWWSMVKPKVEKGWSEAYDRFFEEEYHIVVSYGTDPAYSMYFYNSTRYGAALVKYNGKLYGWLQIEGIALVKNAPHKEAAKKFIDWFLSVEVQQYIPLNNWMYPANKNVELPEAYEYAINMSNVEIVNRYISIDEIAANLESWLDEWVDIMVTD